MYNCQGELKVLAHSSFDQNMENIPDNQIAASSWKSRVSRPWRWFGRTINNRPMLFFFGTLILLTGAIVLGSFIRKPQESMAEKEISPKEVSTFSLGDSSKIIVSASVRKSGVVTIMAQSAGIVSAVNVKEGDKVGQGKTLVSLSTTYQGGTIQSVSRQVAEKNYNFTVDNYSLQREALARQRDAAENANAQSVDLRNITRESLDDTRALIAMNQESLTNLNNQIAALESANEEGVNNEAIAQAKQSRATLVSGLNQLESGLRNSEYQSDDDQEPAHLSNNQKEATFRQLEIQEKTLDLNKELASLNLRVAQITESLMYPASPFAGTVEKVFVKKGQSVAPGTAIVQITGTQTSVSAVALVSKNIASRISRIEDSKAILEGKVIQILPRYISTQPTDGNMYSVFYTIPVDEAENFIDNETILLEIPLASEKNESSDLFIPVDAVYQTQEYSYIFVAETGEDGKSHAVEKQISLGSVEGSFVRVIDGVEKDMNIILNRNVVAGDVVKAFDTRD
jgi:multidrug efflux pump subunit AcrA (membrane-fusion protein)